MQLTQNKTIEIKEAICIPLTFIFDMHKNDFVIIQVWVSEQDRVRCRVLFCFDRTHFSLQRVMENFNLYAEP